MTEKSLQEYIGLENGDKLIDVKMSIEDNKASPNDFLDQLSKIVKSDQENLLTDFIDY